MSPNTAPIKYAQRKDSLYLTIALAGALRNPCCLCRGYYHIVCSGKVVDDELSNRGRVALFLYLKFTVQLL